MDRVARYFRIGFARWVDGRPLGILSLIMLLAFSLNATRLVVTPPTLEMGDAAQYWEVALNINRGLGYVACYADYFPFCGSANQATAAREPVPVLAIALITSLTRESLYAVAITQLTLNLIIGMGIFYLTRELVGLRAALVAAFLWSIYLPAIQLVPEIGGDLWAALGMTWGLYFFVKGLRTEHGRDWFAAGVGIGLAVLSRSAIMIVAATLTAGLFWVLRPARRRMQSLVVRLKAPLLFALTIGLMQLPWLAHTFVSFGRPVIGTTLVGYNLFRGNYMLANDNYLHFVGPDEAMRAIRALVQRQADLQGNENEVQMDAVYRGEAMRIITTNPLHYTLLSGYRFFMLWFNLTVTESYGSANTGLHEVEMAEQLMLVILLAVGLHGNGRSAWPILISILSLTLTYMLVISRLRYLIPVMPLVVSFGTLSITRPKPIWLKKFTHMRI